MGFSFTHGDNTCPVCGRYFVAYEEWAYKDYKNSNVVKFCSWSCLKKWRVNNPPGKNRKKGLVVTEHGR